MINFYIKFWLAGDDDLVLKFNSIAIPSDFQNYVIP